MSNCHVRELSHVYTALFQDAVYAYPTLRTEFEKDLARLLSLVERRGIRVYLEDLPAVGKHLDRCLSCGSYKLSGLPLTKRYSNRVVIPKFLRGLYLRVFHETGYLKEDYDVQAVFFLRQLLFAAKKATVACSASDVEKEVLEFFAIDKVLPEPEKFWEKPDSTLADIKETYLGFGKSDLYGARVDSLVSSKRNQLSILLARLDSVSSLVCSALGSYDPSMWNFRHGPGVVSETTGSSNKYCWKNWSDRLEREYPIADYGFHNYAAWADRCHSDESLGSREPYSRMVAVPKSYSKPRLIAAEPSENQWCQQNCWHYFSHRCGNSWINQFLRFRDQTLNQELCKSGSLDGTLATVDLSAASDRVTCHAVGQFFRAPREGRSSVLLALQACRTRFIQQKLTRHVPELVALRKFSTMGNGCTFPVESLLFLGIALATVLTVRKLKATLTNIRDLAGEVAIYGDDIVIPVDSRELFVEALEILDFKVNAGKSYWTGRFRESCGVDSLGGVDVTPVYWKQPYNGKPGSLASVLMTRNNFYQKFLLATARRLASTLPGPLPSVDMSSGVLGLKTRLSPENNSLIRRYNSGLQRVEARVVSLIARQQRTPVYDDTAFLQYFTEAPSPLVKWCSGVPQEPELRMKPRWVSVDLLATQQGVQSRE
jgi:hypothetical protein